MNALSLIAILPIYFLIGYLFVAHTTVRFWFSAKWTEYNAYNADGNESAEIRHNLTMLSSAATPAMAAEETEDATVRMDEG